MNECNDFLETTEVFVKNINNSLNERSQLIDSFEILLEKIIDYQRTDNSGDTSFRALLSLYDVLVKSMKFSLAVDEDAILIYETRQLRKFKENFRGD